MVLEENFVLVTSGFGRYEKVGGEVVCIFPAVTRTANVLS